MSQLTFDAAAAKSTEAIYLTPDVVAQRARVLDLLSPSGGETIADIGVGPGLLALDLARLVGPEGRLFGFDLSADMAAMAAARLSEFPQAEIVVADALSLPLADGALDAAVSTQVYEYVADMPAALAELRRVLRPGGRAVILDTDWRSIVWRSSDDARMERVLACWDRHLADPHLPSRLPTLLRQAGFELRRVEALTMLSPRWQPVSYAGGMTRTIYGFVRRTAAAAGLEASEVEAWWADQQDLIARDEFFFSLNRYAFVATA